jgi:hypothetical protein
MIDIIKEKLKEFLSKKDTDEDMKELVRKYFFDFYVLLSEYYKTLSDEAAKQHYINYFGDVIIRVNIDNHGNRTYTKLKELK